MLLKDRIYGTFDIIEPVVLELLHSGPLVRLKKINQAGASKYLFSWKNVTRYEHSLGVMLLLKTFGASLEEQISGLLHDLPHTAFSHVVDFVYQNENHEYHEQFHESMVWETEVGEILKKHQISESVTHPENFPLLERNIPDLCADRIDYALRDLFALQKDRESIVAKLAGLTVYRNEFMFKTQIAAEAFAIDYLTHDEEVWAHPKEIASYLILAQALRHALDKGIIDHKDLFTDDETVMLKSRQEGDMYVNKKLNYLTPKFRIEPATPSHYHFFVKSKVRYVDPKILVTKKVVRLSEVSTRFKSRLKEHISDSQRGSYIFVYPE